MILFGEEFEIAGAARAPVRPSAAQREAASAQVAADERIAAIERAYAQGTADGMARAEDARTAAVERWTALCAERLRDADGEMAALAEATASGLAGVVIQSLRQLLPALCARHGGLEVAALARRLLPALRAEPRIAVRHNPHDAAALAAALGDIPTSLHEAVRLLPTDAVAAGDLHVDWQDGHAVRDTAFLLSCIAALLDEAGLAETVGAGDRVIEPAWRQ